MSGIIQELQEDLKNAYHRIDELESESSKLSELLVNKRVLVELSLKYELVESPQIEVSREPIKLRGIALAEGKWKGVDYHYEEFSKLDGIELDINVEHDESEQFKNKIVGKCKLFKDDTLRCLKFEGTVDDPLATQLIRNGTFPAVSISVWMDYIPTSRGVEGMNFRAKNLSLCRVPACKTCVIVGTEQSLSSQEQHIDHRCTDMNEAEIAVLVDTVAQKLAEKNPKYKYGYPYKGKKKEGEGLTIDDVVQDLTETIVSLETGLAESTKCRAEVVEKVTALEGKLSAIEAQLATKDEEAKKKEEEAKKAEEEKKKIEEEEEELAKLAKEHDLQNGEDYKKFMKECMTSGKDMKACAVEYKKKGKGQEEQSLMEKITDSNGKLKITSGELAVQLGLSSGE